MVKGLIYGLFVLALMGWTAAFYFQKSAKTAQKNSGIYRHNCEILYSKLKEAYETNVQLDKTKKALEMAARKDKTAFDWGADISHSPVILQLQAD